jgi:hypothetical protein
LAFEFFRDKGFFGEHFLFLDVSSFMMGSLGDVTSSCFYFFSSPSSSSLYTSSPPPPLGESVVVFFDALINSCTSSFFFFLLLLGASYSSQVTTRLLMRLGLESFVCSTGKRNSTGHSLVISSMSSSVSL